jgi:hypothetical protein
LGKEFLDITPKANLQKEKKMYTVHFLKVKNFYHSKGSKKMKRLIQGEKYLQIIYLIRDISRIYEKPM